MKKTMTVVLLALLSLLLAVSCDTAKASDGYEVGKKGPSGGLIVYVNPNAETDGWTYLEAAPADVVVNGTTTFMIGYYYPSNTSSPASFSTEKEIGKGKSNTEKLLETKSYRHTALNYSSTVVGDNDFAPKVASDYTVKGCSGWFLPSLEELKLMWEMKTELGMNAETYLSSTVADSCYVVSTKDIAKQYNEKYIVGNATAAVRCVRTF